jgi:hypothetical protein
MIYMIYILNNLTELSGNTCSSWWSNTAAPRRRPIEKFSEEERKAWMKRT